MATQTGLRATDTGSTITASNAAITMGPANGTTAASNMTGALAANSASLSLTNTSVRMLGGGNGVSNKGLVASGANSQITFMGGAISTLSRGSFGAWADGGGLITLGNAAQITTTDTTVYNTSIPIAVPFGNTDIEFASGITTKLVDDASIYIRLSYLTSINGNYQQMIRGQFGVRYVW